MGMKSHGTLGGFNTLDQNFLDDHRTLIVSLLKGLKKWDGVHLKRLLRV